MIAEQRSRGAISGDEDPCDCFICRGEASEEFIQSILDAEPDGPAVSAEEFIKRLRETFESEAGEE